MVHLFLSGDVMTGRGIDQILPFPSDPTLYEWSVKDAKDYVELAERANGPIPRRVHWEYVWGTARAVFDRLAPDVRIVNLETSVTASNDHWPGKGIHYRMSPRNVACLTAGGIDCCTLANNHVLDWGYSGLQETLQTLADAGIRTAGAGQTLEEARQPALFTVSAGQQIALLACAAPSSGVPMRWAATDERPGLFVIDEYDPQAARWICDWSSEFRQPGRLIVVSVHWGDNWGYAVPAAQRSFAHHLIDEGGVALVFGHSSHHVKGLEVYRGRLIVYGAGDLITDYEGIATYEQYRGDLGLMYFPRLDVTTGELLELRLAPTQMKRFQLVRPAAEEIAWLVGVLNREGQGFGTSVVCEGGEDLVLRWSPSAAAVRAGPTA